MDKITRCPRCSNVMADHEDSIRFRCNKCGDKKTEVKSLAGLVSVNVNALVGNPGEEIEEAEGDEDAEEAVEEAPAPKKPAKAAKGKKGKKGKKR